MKGATLNLAGDLANEGAGLLSLERTAGTTITGSGYLPPVSIASGSSGNVINGAKALIDELLGTNNVRGGDDFDPTAASANGDLDFVGGTASLTASFGSGVSFDDTHLNDLTTVAANNTLTLGADLIVANDLTHPAGTIDVGAHTLTVMGGTQNITGGAKVIGSGWLAFVTQGATTLTVNTGNATIDANLLVDPTSGDLTLDNAGKDLTVNGDLSIDGTAGNIDIGNGRTLTAAGYNLSMAAGTGITAGGTGILKSDVADADSNQTLAADGAVTITNLTVADDLALDLSGATPSVTITGNFKHTGGNLDFSEYDLTISGTFTRTAGTYSATDGFLDINTASFDQGSSNFEIPNLRFTANAAATVANQTGIITVTQALDVQQPGSVDLVDATNTGNKNILSVADGAQVIFGTTASSLTKFDVVPNYLGQVNFVSQITSDEVIHATIWPSTPANLAKSLTLMNGALGDDFELPGDRNVSDLLDLQVGTLNLGETAVRKLTLTGSTVRRRENGAVVRTGTAGTGSLLFTGTPDVIYEPDNAGAITAGVELPSVVSSLTITRSANKGNSNVTIGSAITVNGDLTVKNNLIANNNITLLGNLVVGRDSYSNATAPVVTFGAGTALTFSGDADQMITLPAGVTNFGSINVNNGHSVIVEGGNLSLDLDPTATPNTVNGNLTLTNGLLVTGDNYIQLDNPTAANSTNQGFTRNVATGNVSHVVGNVRKALKSGTNPGLGRNEYPVGSESTYRKASVTVVDAVNGNAPLGVSVTISGVAEQPTGVVGLPIVNGVSDGIDIARYPNFYWNISSSSSLGQTKFDLELSSENYSDFANVANLRIIRRQGVASDISNEWSLQGTNSSYDNFSSLGTVSVVNVNATGGIRPEGGIFTFGQRTRLSASELPNLTLNQGEAYTVAISLTGVFSGSQGELVYTASSTNEAVATVEVDGDTLYVTGTGNGQTEISVRATDTNQDFLTVTFTASTNPVGVAGLGIPTTFALEQNYPNPFNPTTVIRFGIPEQSNVILRVYNILGQEVATLLNTVKAAGWHEVNFNAAQLGSGLYIYRIEAKDFVSIKKMMLVK